MYVFTSHKVMDSTSVGGLLWTSSVVGRSELGLLVSINSTGLLVGKILGGSVGFPVGKFDGDIVGLGVSEIVGITVGLGVVGDAVGSTIGLGVGLAIKRYA